MEDRVGALEQRLALLEDQVARLLAHDQHERGTTLVAPVRIVDASGVPIVEVHATQHDRSVRLLNDQGRVVATLGVDGTQCGYLAIRNSVGSLVGYLDVERAGARLILTNHTNRGGIVLFGGDSGHDRGGGINVNSTGGYVGLSIWSGANNGELHIYTADQEEPIVILPASSDAS